MFKQAIVAALAVASMAAPATAEKYRISFSGTTSSYSQCGGCQGFTDPQPFAGFIDYDSLNGLPPGMPVEWRIPSFALTLTSGALDALGVPAYSGEYLPLAGMNAFGSTLFISGDYSPSFSLTVDLGTPLPRASNPITLPTGTSFVSGTFGFANSAGNGGSGRQFSGALSSFAISAVPEPATWAMMIGGFAVAAGALRVRRKKIAALV